MKTSTRVLLVLGVTLAVTTLIAVALAAVFVPVTATPLRPASTAATTPATTSELPDGTWFGWVRVGDAGGAVQLVIDPAEWLTGDEARVAAVAAGVIAPHEDLPNDVFIVNPTRELFTNTVSSDAVLVVSSSLAPFEQINLTPADLLSVFEGTYEERLIYGIIPGQAIPMNLTVDGGIVTAATKVFLP